GELEKREPGSFHVSRQEHGAGQRNLANRAAMRTRCATSRAAECIGLHSTYRSHVTSSLPPRIARVHREAIGESVDQTGVAGPTLVESARLSRGNLAVGRLWLVVIGEGLDGTYPLPDRGADVEAALARSLRPMDVLGHVAEGEYQVLVVDATDELTSATGARLAAELKTIGVDTAITEQRLPTASAPPDLEALLPRIAAGT